MKIKILPAQHGRRWLRQAFELIKKQPIRVAMAVLTFVVITVLVSRVPTIGPFIALAVSPILGLCLCSFFRMIDNKQTPQLRDFFAPFSLGNPIVMRLVLIGLINSLGFALLIYLTTLVDGGLLMKVLQGGINLNDPRLKDPSLTWGIFLFTALIIPFQAALWYAPQFVGWHNLGITQSFFYSLIAVWRNRGAYLNFLLSWMMLSIGVLAVYIITGSLFVAVLGKAGAPLAGIIQVPGSIIMSALAYGAFWYSYADILVDEIPTQNDVNQQA